MNNYSILDLHILNYKDCDEMVKLKKKKVIFANKRSQTMVSSIFLLPEILWYYDNSIIWDKGAWWAAVHGVSKSRLQLSTGHGLKFMVSEHC